MKEKLFGLGVFWFCILLGVMGTTEGILSCLSLDYQPQKLYLGVALFSLAWTLLLYSDLFGKIAPAFLSLPFLVVLSFAWNRKLLFGGLMAVGSQVLKEVNQVFQTRFIWRLDGSDYSPEAVTAAMLLIMAWYAWLLAWAMLSQSSGWKVFFLCSLPFVGALLLNQLLPVRAILLLILCCVGTVSAFGDNDHISSDFRWKSCLSMMVLVLAASAAARLVVFPFMERHSQEMIKANAKVRDFAEKTFWTKLWGGQTLLVDSMGTLNREDEIEYTGTTALEITLEHAPPETIYLKGYVGADYTGENWEANDTADLERYWKDHGWEIPKELQQDVFQLSYQAAEEIDRKSERMGNDWMYVKVAAAPNHFLYLPYAAHADIPLEFEGEGSVLAEGETQWQVPYYSRARYCYMGESALSEDLYWQTLEQQYESYVYDRYRDYPAKKLPRLFEVCSQQQFDSVQEMAAYVEQYLAQMAVYDLKAGACPEGKDFTEYFLYENKKGYCVHFATAATLMFRMMGVPARYVTGYVAFMGDFVESKDYYVTEVPDDHAHAWTEIYVSPYGWIPVDATPPGDRTQDVERRIPDRTVFEAPQVIPEETQQEEAKKDDGGQDTSSGLEENTEHKTKSPSEESKASDPEMPSGLGKVSGGVLLLLAVVTVWISAGRLRRVKKAGQRADEVILDIFDSTRQALKLAGFPKGISPSSMEFQEEILKKCDKISREDFNAFMELVMFAMFADSSQKKLKRQDVQEARRMYRKICHGLEEQMPLLKKLYFRVSRARY